MKRICIIVFALMMATMLLTACQPNATETPDNEGAADAETEQGTEEKQPEEVSTDDGDKEEAERITIGLSFPTLQEERWAIESEIAKEYCEELGIEIIIQDAGNDSTLQNQQVENMITQGIDVLIIGPDDVDATAAAVEAANNEGIPVISYLRNVNSDKLAGFIGYDFEGIGKVKAQAALDAVPEGNYVFLNGDEGDSVVHEMMRGYEAVLKEAYDSGKVDKIFEQFTQEWKPENALANMENCLTLNDNDVQVVIGNNDHVAGAAIQALEGQGVENIYVNGMDGDIAACQRIVEGKQAATVVFYHDVLVESAVNAAIAIAKGEDPGFNGKVANAVAEVDAILLVADLVTADNMVEKVIKTGMHPIEDVYVNVPKDQWPAE